LAGFQRLVVNDIEFHLPSPHFTADTLRALELRHPETRFSLLLGADTLRTLHTWKDTERIAAHSPLYVYPRHGEDAALSSVWETAHPDVKVIRMPGDLHPFSSTEVRNALRAGQPADAMLPEALRGEAALVAAYGPRGQVLL